MRSLQSPSLLRALGTHPAHSLISHHLRPNYLLTTIPRISPSPPPFHKIHHIQNARRSFHWQSTLSTAIEGTQTLMINFHAGTNLPWFMVIPLVAITVGAVFRLPFSIYSQRILQRRAEFRSLLQAWNVQLQHDVVRAGSVPLSGQLAEVKKRQEKILKRIYAKLGLQNWRLWGSLLSFPFWLVAIDGVRRLCGGPRGLIGSLITGSESEGSKESVGTSGTGETASAATGLPPGTESGAFDPAIVSSAAESVSIPTTTTPIDPSLSFEGCLWFTDLTTSDPYHILPLLLSASLIYNLLPRSPSPSPSPSSSPSTSPSSPFSPLRDRFRIAFGRLPRSSRARTLASDEKIGFRERIVALFHICMIGVAALVGPLTMDLPAALHLYWLASSLANAVFMRVVKRFIPVKQRLLKGCTNNEFLFIRPTRAGKS